MLGLSVQTLLCWFWRTVASLAPKSKRHSIIYIWRLRNILLTLTLIILIQSLSFHFRIHSFRVLFSWRFLYFQIASSESFVNQINIATRTRFWTHQFPLCLHLDRFVWFDQLVLAVSAAEYRSVLVEIQCRACILVSSWLTINNFVTGVSRIINISKL